MSSTSFKQLAPQRPTRRGCRLQFKLGCLTGLHVRVMVFHRRLEGQRVVGRGTEKKKTAAERTPTQRSTSYPVGLLLRSQTERRKYSFRSSRFPPIATVFRCKASTCFYYYMYMYVRAPVKGEEGFRWWLGVYQVPATVEKPPFSAAPLPRVSIRRELYTQLCVLHIEPFSLLVDIQHTWFSYWIFLPERYELRGSKTCTQYVSPGVDRC